jgi:hypothetical protein
MNHELFDGKRKKKRAMTIIESDTCLWRSSKAKRESQHVEVIHLYTLVYGRSQYSPPAHYKTLKNVGMEGWAHVQTYVKIPSLLK